MLIFLNAYCPAPHNMRLCTVGAFSCGGGYIRSEARKNSYQCFGDPAHAKDQYFLPVKHDALHLQCKHDSTFCGGESIHDGKLFTVQIIGHIDVFL